jgi:hypothetical protein
MLFLYPHPLSGIITRVHRVRVGCLVASTIVLVAAAVLAVTVGPSSGRPGAVPPLAPELAPMPSPPLRTPTVTLTRIGPTGVTQVVTISPDGDWMFNPYRGSVRASVINHGRLTSAEHVALAQTLAGARFRAEAAMAPGECRAGASYRLIAGRIDANWTECEAADRPVLTDLLDRIVSIARF